MGLCSVAQSGILGVRRDACLLSGVDWVGLRPFGLFGFPTRTWSRL